MVRTPELASNRNLRRAMEPRWISPRSTTARKKSRTSTIIKTKASERCCRVTGIQSQHRHPAIPRFVASYRCALPSEEQNHCHTHAKSPTAIRGSFYPATGKAVTRGWKLSWLASSLIEEYRCAFPRMRFLRQLFIFFFVSCLSCAVVGAADPPKRVAVVSNSASSSVLPAGFAGWQVKGAVDKSDDPMGADAANAPVLKEYGFVRLEKAVYTRDDGRILTIKAAVCD